MSPSRYIATGLLEVSCFVAFARRRGLQGACSLAKRGPMCHHQGCQIARSPPSVNDRRSRIARSSRRLRGGSRRPTSNARASKLTPNERCSARRSALGGSKVRSEIGPHSRSRTHYPEFPDLRSNAVWAACSVARIALLASTTRKK